MQSSRGWFSFMDDSVTETLSQALQGTGEQPDREPDTEILFGNLRGSVVGLRYYTGVVNKREMVSLVRQPQNPHDRNAVMVANVYGSQVGHIKRELAASLANIMDNNLARIDGVVPFGATNVFTMPVVLSFWGTEENRHAVVQQLSSHGFKLQTGSSGTNTHAHCANAASCVGICLTLCLKNAFDSLFEDLMEDKNGEREAAVCTPLLPHQKQALSWMCVCENSVALPPFWEDKGGLFYNTLTYSSVRERPQRVRGGILADDMGLGKTLTTIALILSNFHNGKPLPLEKCTKTSATPRKHSLPGGDTIICSLSLRPVGFLQCSNLRQTDCIPRLRVCENSPGNMPAFLCLCTCVCVGKRAGSEVGAAIAAPSPSPDDTAATTTLIICPLSVLSNWLDQLEQHVRPDVRLNVYLYYGPERNRDPRFLSTQHVVLTTYNVMTADYSGSGGPLHSVTWLRVVLDEGHVIRNPNAQQSKAVLDLNAHRRWILSGTPIQNSLKDLWMLVAFLRLKPFDVREWWNRVIQRPVTVGDKTGLGNLQALVRCITLRRTKTSRVGGRPLVSLPKRSFNIEEVELTTREREEYELARTEGRATISRYVEEGSVLRNYADVLAILVRLRQFCCHPDLLGSTLSQTGVVTATPAELRERLIERLRLVLGSGSDEECPVCLSSVRLAVITHCAHVYCRPCIAEVLRTEQPARCPLCRGPIKASELVEFPQEVEEEAGGYPSENWRSSSKVDALMSSLLRLRCEDSSIKSLVVSQFTRFLSLLEVPLREEGFRFVRLDGTMSQRRRAQVIQEFQSHSPGSPLVMLLSLKAGGVGLNLTAASHVFLMDPAWNPAVEDQCVDRCHRLGQTRDVVITKFIVKDSVEENMVKIQRQKQDLVEKAFGTNPSKRKTSRIEEIQALMEL
uniref:Helicase-like transcription factor n=1 Tax=Esox lucius TaxID=8010 RepID=A0A6Q2Z996_ESOLU